MSIRIRYLRFSKPVKYSYSLANEWFYRGSIVQEGENFSLQRGGMKKLWIKIKALKT